MATFEHALLLLLLVTALSVVARYLPWPEPITYVLGGIAFAFVPAFPRVAFDPGFFFVCFLPPLLFSDGWLMPLREFVRERRSILVYATGLVAFTTVGIGLVAYWLVPGLPLALAFALGAVISPTDAVSVNAITEKLKVPTRLRVVLNGESLMNDATGLVGFKFALAALIAGSFSLRSLAFQFLLIAVGGLLAGVAVGYLVGKLRDLVVRAHGAEPLVETTLSLLTPYAAYFAAHALHVSDILAVVAAGLYSGWRDPVKTDAASRQTAWTVWSTVLFWLNGLAFVLLGLQFPGLFATVSGMYSTTQLLGFTAAIAGMAMLLRLAWFFPSTYVLARFSRALGAKESPPSWREAMVGGWAGMRGAVTFAAALSIPLTLPDGAPLPGRDIVIFLAFGVVLVTLVVQGTSLSWLIRRLGLGEDGVREREELVARTAAVRAGLSVLRGLETQCTASQENAALGHVVAEYEQRLSELVAEGETRENARLRRAAEKHFRFAALKAERAALDDLWRRDEIADEVYRPLQNLLDYEEAMLSAKPTGEPGP
ncbi:MAG TPA: Na+/H+ antiporter [Opitutaceae bacterium]|nr:Na+/H+ antiporter [Opitutaceae bacterium]